MGQPATPMKLNPGDTIKGCPNAYLEIAKQLRRLTYPDMPPYKEFIDLLKAHLPKNLKMTDPYEWDAKPSTPNARNPRNKDADQKQEVEKDRATVNEIDESIVTDDMNSSMDDSGNEGFAKEDTLEGL
ncbi:hypothetical protein WR25_21818 [Diploscapter pachys]|uniref:Uncharacterized protein n=1 Tax=Diploscapter pachys TaxID=2018661 RepID=A0A2A2L7I8_9BILA|nr:hypothetical protein WR25_21818 [Diploscapter pachys]